MRCTFSQKSLKGASGGRRMMDEEGWLDEAMGHLAEDLNGFSMSNIDYRVSAFLTQSGTVPARGG